MKNLTSVAGCALIVFLYLASYLASAARDASACGGCFAPPETITSVDSHRMVVSLSPRKTILWDQIRYSGAPADFVWVLPIPSADAVVDVAAESFFNDLEEQTAPRIQRPFVPAPQDCAPPPDGFGFQDAGASGSVSDAGVDVYREEVVGPYQTVVIGSEDPNALITWLRDNDYAVPEATRPVLSHYIATGSLFVVLRLAPEQDVNAMQPVRVEYPGYMGSFPLKMVTVGAYGTLELTLWVIAEQRYEARNYGTVTINERSLLWDFDRSRSNYQELFRGGIDAAGGRAWVAEYARSLNSLWFQDQSEPERARATIAQPYITRLRTEQLLDHLTEDLQLAPSPSAANISNIHQLTLAQAINIPTRTCPDWDGDGRPDTNASAATAGSPTGGCSSVRSGSAFLMVLAIMLVVVAIRRRRDGMGGS